MSNNIIKIICDLKATRAAASSTIAQPPAPSVSPLTQVSVPAASVPQVPLVPQVPPAGQIHQIQGLVQGTLVTKEGKQFFRYPDGKV